MPVFACAACSKKLKVDDQFAGKRVNCPGCGKPVLVPELALTPPKSMLARPMELTQAGTLAPKSEFLGDQPTQPPSASSSQTSDGTSHEDDEAESLTDFLSPAQAADEVGRLGVYRILKVLGRGGMGVVFQAEDPKLKRKVAVKAMLPAVAKNKSAAKRFLREAQAMAAVEHTHIARIYQVDEERGVPFLAMEFLKGETLDDRLRRDKILPMGEILRIGREIAKGLAAAHENDLIHRDIKPGNIWLEGKDAHVKILDFGLARSLADQAHLTQTGAIVGTPAYMAPEQAGGKPVDHRCDLFSLGCVLYRMLTGKLPFQGSDAMSILMALALESPEPPAAMNAETPEAVSNLVMQLLEKMPEKRPATAQAVVAELTTLAEMQIAVRSAPPPKPPSKSQPSPKKPAVKPVPKVAAATLIQPPGRPRPRWPLFAAAGVLLAVAGGYGAFLVSTRAPAPQPPVLKADAKKPPVDAPIAKLDPLGKLDPAEIPAGERVDRQPKELVAVIGEHRQRHWGLLTALAISRDGKRIASGGWDHKVRVWDTETMRELAILDQTLGSRAVAFSDDGTVLATLDHVKLHLWDMTKPQPQETGTNNAAGTAVAFSRDGKRIAYGFGWDVLVMSVDKGTFVGNPLPALTGHKGGPVFLRFNADGNTLLVGAADGTLHTWDLKEKAPKLLSAVMVAPQGANTMAVSADGKTVITTKAEQPLRVWKLTEKEVVPAGELPGFFSCVPGEVALAPDDRTFAANREGNIGIFDVGDKSLPLRTEIHGYAVLHGVAFSADGKSIAAGFANGAAQVYQQSGDKWSTRFPLSEKTHNPRTIAWSPDGTTVAVGSSDVLRLWDLTGTRPQQRAEIALEAPRTSHATYSADGSLLAIFEDFRHKISVWNVTGREPVKVHEFQTWQDWGSCRFHPRKNILLTGGAGNIELWDLGKKDPVRLAELRADRGVVYGDFCSGGDAVVTWGAGAVRLWRQIPSKFVDKPGFEWKTVSEVPIMPNESSVAVSPDGQRLVIAFADGTNRVFNITDAAILPLNDFAFSVGTNSMVFRADNRSYWRTTVAGFAIELNDLAGKSLGTIRMPGDSSELAIAPNGRHIAALNYNGTVYILRVGDPDFLPK